MTRTLEPDAPIETFGQGARGFNIYAGTVHSATFDRIVTHADGAVGVQISEPAGKITVLRGMETFGGAGPSLVKGAIPQLSAIALSVNPAPRLKPSRSTASLRPIASKPSHSSNSVRSAVC